MWKCCFVCDFYKLLVIVTDFRVNTMMMLAFFIFKKQQLWKCTIFGLYNFDSRGTFHSYMMLQVLQVHNTVLFYIFF